MEMEQASLKRAVRVTLELVDGTIQSYALNENDGMVCFLVSKKQNFAQYIGYCSDTELQLWLLENLVYVAKDLERTVKLQRWIDLHKS